MDDPGGAGTFDAAVVGAGAAGLVAAICAAERGLRVVLLEKNRRAGVKILMSGGTRCNVTNARGLRDVRAVSGPVDPAFDPRLCRGAKAIADAYGPAGPFLRPALRGLGVDETARLFEAEGVPLKVEANGKIFPVSDRAVDVLEALLRRLARSGAELRVSSAARAVEAEGDAGFRVVMDNGFVRAGRVIVAVGGRSYPGSGTTGDGYAIAAHFGHTIVEPRPALVPIRVAAEWPASLRGVTVPDVWLRVVDASGHVLAERRESLLFAHFGLTGPAARAVSRAVARDDQPMSLRVRIDFAPKTSFEELDRMIAEAARRGRPTVSSLLPATLPRRLGEALLHVAGVPPDLPGPELSREARRKLVAALKGTELPAAGTLGFEKAEVTSGGVALNEVDPATMQSRKQPGLFLCGEVLDLDGPIGGYNFQAAWSTGWRAGMSV